MGASASIPAALRPCAPFTSELDLSMYEATVFGNFQGLVQYNLEAGAPYVADACDAVVAAPDALGGLAAATALFYPDASDSGAPLAARCIESDFQKDYIDRYLANASFSPAGCDLDCASDRQWVYQSCNEFGYVYVRFASRTRPRARTLRI